MLTALAILAVVLAMAAGFLLGRRSSQAEDEVAKPVLPPVAVQPALARPAHAAPAEESTPIAAERARLLRSFEAQAARAERVADGLSAAISHLADLAEERRALFGELAASKTETARYRQLVVDIETNAPPPLLGGPGTPDDLKLIVGVGPVLERMLHQLGITTYRQIARWTERDIDVFDGRLAEFPGRIRRDGWVTQARALHQSFHGEAL